MQALPATCDPRTCCRPLVSSPSGRRARLHLANAAQHSNSDTPASRQRHEPAAGDAAPLSGAGNSRRKALLQLAALAAALDTGTRWVRPDRADAALVQFPTSRLKNRYILVRAGESTAEAAGYVLTNPVAKTSMDSGLSQLGKRQVVKGALPAIRNADGFDWDNESIYIWPSITQRSYQTAEILGSQLGVSRNRIVPEFSFLDPRGLGALEGYTLEEASLQVEAGDRQSPSWRPFHGTDGTPNESAADVLVRVRQVVSITESQWSGAVIIIVSPDSDNLSILQAAAVGADLRNHRQFGFQPGEARVLQLSPELPTANTSARFACPHPPACV